MAEDPTVKIKFSGEDAGLSAASKNAAADIKQVSAAQLKSVDVSGAQRKEFVQVAGAFTALAVASQIRGALFGVAMAADEIARGMSGVRSVAGDLGSTGADLQKEMLRVGEKVGSSFTEIAAATKNLLAQSLSPADVKNLLEPLSMFQRVSGLAADQATNLVVALTNLGIRSGDVSGALDKMKSLADATALDIKDFAEVVTKAGPTAISLGINFDSLAQSAALLRRGFASGAMEGTSLNRAMLALADPKKRDKLQAAFGVDVVDHSSGQMRDLNDIMYDLSKQIDGSVEKTGALGTIFGQRTAPLLLAGATAFRTGMDFAGQGVLKGIDLVNALKNQTASAEGSVGKAFAFTMQNMAAQLDRLTVALNDFAGTIFGRLAANLATGIGMLASMIDSFREFIAFVPGLSTLVGGVAGLVGYFLLAVSAVLSFAGALGLAKFAGVFLTNTLQSLGIGLAVTGTEATVAAGSVGLLSTALAGARGIVTLLKGSLASLFKVALGPLGIILLLFEVVPMIGKWLGIGDSTVKKAGDVAANQAKTAEGMAKSAEGFSGISEKLGSIIDEFTGKAIKKFPVLDEKTVGVLDQVLTKAGKLDETLRPEALQGIGDAVQTVFDVARKGETVTPEIFDRAAIALQTAIGFSAEQAARQIPGAAQQQKVLMDMLENMKIAVSPEVAIQRQREAALRSVGGSIYAANTKEGITSMGRPAMSWGGTPEENAMRVAEGRVQSIAAAGPGTTLGAGTAKDKVFERAEFKGAVFPGTFHLELDGQSLPGSLRNASQRDQVRGLGGR